MDEPKNKLAKIEVPSEIATATTSNLRNLDLSQIKNLATVMAGSGMFKDVMSANQAFVKILAGQEMGVAPFQAMSDIHIIQGKATAGGNIYAGKIKSHPKYDYRIKVWDENGCEIQFLERIAGKVIPIGTSSFTHADAQRAGLLSNPSWSKYPRNMYFNRAMTNGVRTFCPDALGGMAAYTPEELGDRDYIEAEATYTQPTHVTEPEETKPVDDGLLEEDEALNEQFKDAVHEPTEDELAGNIDLPDEPTPRKKNA